MDFVDFDIAKKLKEKGFREKVNAYYGKHENIFEVHPSLDMNDCDYRCSAPTISQVLRWLREKNATHIEISLGRDGWYFEIIQYEYYEEEKEYDCKLKTISFINDSYEEAAIAGIESVLNNLI